MDNYDKLARVNLERLYDNLPPDLDTKLPAAKEGLNFTFPAFGRICVISPDGITLDGEAAPGVIAILLSLYALHASDATQVVEPFKAFKEFPDSAPYVGAFAAHTERILIPAVDRIQTNMGVIKQLDGQPAPTSVSGDFAFVVCPLPKIALCYIFYLADEEFPAAVTCLFSANAHHFMPMDGLADVGEYTSKTILNLIQ